MGNRVPRAGGEFLCCLVSVEERTDLLPVTDVVAGGFDLFEDAAIAEISDVTALSPIATPSSTIITAQIMTPPTVSVSNSIYRGQSPIFSLPEG